MGLFTTHLSLSTIPTFGTLLEEGVYMERKKIIDVYNAIMKPSKIMNWYIFGLCKFSWIYMITIGTLKLVLFMNRMLLIWLYHEISIAF